MDQLQFSIAGSIFLLFTSLPFNGYTEFYKSNSFWCWVGLSFSICRIRLSFKLMAIFVVIGMAKSLANYYKVDSKLAIALSLLEFYY